MIASLPDALYRIALTAWIGGMWAVGYLAAPTLFAQLPDDHMLAGRLAGELFTWISWVGIVCATYILALTLVRRRRLAFRSLGFWLLLPMLLLTLVGHFGIQPILADLKAQVWPDNVMQSPVAGSFAAWHGVSSILYLIESLLGAALVILQERLRP